MRRVLVGCLSVVLVVAPAPTARAELGVRLVPPVDGPISAAFDEPEGTYGPGHRGVDYRVEVGTPVRAAGDGSVTFAGVVAGVRAVTLSHGSGIETTYTGLSRIEVQVGERIEEGRFLGASGTVHDVPALHLGVKVRGEYVDPVDLLIDLDVAGAIHLAPLAWTPEHLGSLGDSLPRVSAGTARRECRPSGELRAPARPPSDNIVVAVAGITSKTKGGVSADIYEHGPEQLGFPARSTYRFSYAGTEGPGFHEPYPRQETYIDIRTAAARLRALMRRIALKHPGRNVDLIAHSQGGIVARTYLALEAETRDNLPHVEHLVTFASPHRGAPGASQVAPLRDETATGRSLLGAAKNLADGGAPVPDPTSPSVEQLAPGSSLMRALAREDVTFGTRVLALAIPNDPVVPADHALMPGEQGRIVPWAGIGLGGHSAIVTSPAAHDIAYRFLADGAPSCTTGWDVRGPVVGAIWSTLEGSFARTYGIGERVAADAAAAGPGSGVARLLFEFGR